MISAHSYESGIGNEKIWKDTLSFYWSLVICQCNRLCVFLTSESTEHHVATMPFDLVWPHWKLWLTRGHGKFSESSTRPQGQQQARHLELLQWLGQRQSVWIQWFISILCFQMEKIYIYIYMCLYCIVDCISTSIYVYIWLVCLIHDVRQKMHMKVNAFDQTMARYNALMRYANLQERRRHPCPTNLEWRELMPWEGKSSWKQCSSHPTSHPMTNAFLKTGFIFLEHFAVPDSPGWMTSKPISPCVVLNS